MAMKVKAVEKLLKFDKNFQNIFNYFFSLPREKVFPAQRATFSRFLRAGQRGNFARPESNFSLPTALRRSSSSTLQR